LDSPAVSKLRVNPLYFAIIIVQAGTSFGYFYKRTSRLYNPPEMLSTVSFSLFIHTGIKTGIPGGYRFGTLQAHLNYRSKPTSTYRIGIQMGLCFVLNREVCLSLAG
jgi:hypothetical protein